MQQQYATYTYGNDGEKLSDRKTPTRNLTAYAYDGFNRLNLTTFPDMSTEQITSYDKDSNMLARINRVLLGSR